MNRRIFLVKLIHSFIFWFQVVCIAYLLYAAIFRVFSVFLLIPIISIAINGILLYFNNGRCPFTNLAEKYGAESGSVTDLFLPKFIADNIFRTFTPLFFIGLTVIGLRYFLGF